MKKLIMFLLTISLLLSSCQSGEEAAQTPAPSPEGKKPAPVAEGVKSADILDSLVRVGDHYGSLLPLESEDRHVFLSDYAIDINFLMSLDLLIELATPNDELFHLEEIEKITDITGRLNPGARIGIFTAEENYNTAGCRIPIDIKTGEDVYCGFQFSHDGTLYKILVYGTTVRDLENFEQEPTRIVIATHGE